MFCATNLANGLDRSYRRVIFLSPSLKEKTSDIGLLSSSARNDPIFSLISKDGVSSGSKPNFIKLFSIILINLFLRINFLFHLSSKPEGNPGINLFSLFIFLVPGLRIELKLKVPQTFVLTVTPPRHSLFLYYFCVD